MLLSVQKVKEIYGISRSLLPKLGKGRVNNTSVVLNGRENEEDIKEELAEDLIAIVTSFAARIYGQRGAKRHGNGSGQANF